MRIWIHIGLRKTGTTALQGWLLQNSEMLRAQGVAFLQSRPNSGPLARALLKGSPETGKLVEPVLKHIAAVPDTTDGILSSEDFSDLSPEQMQPLIDALAGHDIRILVTLRRQDRLAEALYKQNVKWNGGAHDVQKFLNSDSIRALDYERMLDRWAALPSTRLHPMLYREATETAPPDSIGALLHEIGRAELIPADAPTFRQNISPAAALVKHYQTIARTDGQALRRANRRLMAEMGEAASGRSDLFPAETLKQLRERFAESNAAVCAKWFGRQDSLFPDNDLQQSGASRSDLEQRFDSYFVAERAKLAHKKVDP
ncbi:hypothetical protein [Falsirhodobacter sp. alg1]|uniref:hypothetical protein n=1 Tax=Falsirhodobacter sp. alg1 TaxID=1472418 RepID=UPI0005F0389F|nr:hypothetical protein [Falsirhodobacter sp. alg1]